MVYLSCEQDTLQCFLLKIKSKTTWASLECKKKKRIMDRCVTTENPCLGWAANSNPGKKRQKLRDKASCHVDGRDWQHLILSENMISQFNFTKSPLALETNTQCRREHTRFGGGGGGETAAASEQKSELMSKQLQPQPLLLHLESNGLKNILQSVRAFKLQLKCCWFPSPAAPCRENFL